MKTPWLPRNFERQLVISLKASSRRQELDSHAPLAVVEHFNPYNLGEVIAIAGGPGGMIGECHQQAHPFMVMLMLGEEVKSLE